MDVYSKVIFTVIAAALCVLAVENAGSGARADNVTHVAVCSPSGSSCAEVDGGSPSGGSLRTNVTSRGS
jgi:hypothetical protein